MTGFGRRQVLEGAALTFAATALPRGLLAAERHIPQRPSCRIIADNDYAGDPDGLVALAHQLLTPKARCVLITSSALDPKLACEVPAGTSARAGAEIADELVRRLCLPRTLIAAGAEQPGNLQGTAAARAIVAEAMRDDPLPLIFTCGGPLTNLAAALELEPAIATRMSVIWIGGGGYPDGGWEYNLATDIQAARKVLGHPRLAIRQVPQPAYRQMQMSVAEMRARMRPISPAAAWLYERFTSPPDFVDIGGAWPWGDTPTVLLGSVSSESSSFERQPARWIEDDCRYGKAIPGRTIEVATRLDSRLAIEDFLALLAVNASSAP